MRCIRCGGGRTRRDGQARLGGQRWRCKRYRRRFTGRSTSACSGRGFADDVIALAVRWYVRYRLSYADVAEWLAERGVDVDRSTIYRWVRRFLPLLGEAARRYRCPVGGRWRVDETCCRLNCRWAYCYPPVLRAPLPAVEHRTSKYLNNGLERDHGHLKQRLRPMRGSKHLASADGFSRGHALVKNLRNGFSSLTDRVPRPLRLATAWPPLARAI